MNKKTIKTFAAIMVAGAIIAAPLAASAYPAGDVFHVDQTDTSVAKGERLRVSAAAAYKHCIVKFYQDTDKTIKGATYLGEKEVNSIGDTRSVGAKTGTVGTFYAIAKVIDCPAMADEPRIATAKFRVTK
jgi:hypothetical protein